MTIGVGPSQAVGTDRKAIIQYLYCLTPILRGEGGGGGGGGGGWPGYLELTTIGAVGASCWY